MHWALLCPLDRNLEYLENIIFGKNGLRFQALVFCNWPSSPEFHFGRLAEIVYVMFEMCNDVIECNNSVLNKNQHYYPDPSFPQL